MYTVKVAATEVSTFTVYIYIYIFTVKYMFYVNIYEGAATAPPVFVFNLFLFQRFAPKNPWRGLSESAS